MNDTGVLLVLLGAICMATANVVDAYSDDMRGWLRGVMRGTYVGGFLMFFAGAALMLVAAISSI
jgi:hypothetical protein